MATYYTASIISCFKDCIVVSYWSYNSNSQFFYLIIWSAPCLQMLNRFLESFETEYLAIRSGLQAFFLFQYAITNKSVKQAQRLLRQQTKTT